VPHSRKLAIIGLGYVGLPVAVAFGRQGTRVIGFDIDTARISELKGGRDRTRSCHDRFGNPSSADYSWRRGFLGGERRLNRPAHV
jgi:6-phosphogluconate dehydrogenase (decarboxylating)